MKVLQPWHLLRIARFLAITTQPFLRQAPAVVGDPALLAMCHRYLGLLLRIGARR